MELEQKLEQLHPPQKHRYVVCRCTKLFDMSEGPWKFNVEVKGEDNIAFILQKQH